MAEGAGVGAVLVFIGGATCTSANISNAPAAGALGALGAGRGAGGGVSFGARGAAGEGGATGGGTGAGGGGTGALGAVGGTASTSSSGSKGRLEGTSDIDTASIPRYGFTAGGVVAPCCLSRSSGCTNGLGFGVFGSVLRIITSSRSLIPSRSVS